MSGFTSRLPCLGRHVVVCRQRPVHIDLHAIPTVSREVQEVARIHPVIP